ncbi:MAG: TonB-dependent receptor plug domain-containing protein, partial [Bacteroidia bacterium]|nr:TonB-dependent receptor plug domain-containing protein [Bacteroidia bacterium]
MMRWILSGLLLWNGELFAQIIKGKVFEANTIPPISIVGAKIQVWNQPELGAISDETGEFQIKVNQLSGKIITSFPGFLNDTSDIVDNIVIYLQKPIELQGVEIHSKQASSYISTINTQKTEILTEKELFKAACCNLAESFETNASVDVVTNDAVLGTRQIQLLGLSGVYSQLTKEGIPFVRGLASGYGLNYLPGTWIESIQISKGAGSVSAGMEALTGQINIELRKPETADKLFINGYVNQTGRYELNSNIAYRLGKVESLLLTHGSIWNFNQDENQDSFRDMPETKQINLLQRWSYQHSSGYENKTGFQFVYEDRLGGQFAYQRYQRGNSPYFGADVITQRIEGFTKNGYVFPKNTGASLGSILSFTNHQQTGWFGTRQYQGKQTSIYTNFIYQTPIQTQEHNLKTGLQFLFDNYQETLNDWIFRRKEIVPGIWVEYQWKKPLFQLVTGLRFDYHSLFG